MKLMFFVECKPDHELVRSLASVPIEKVEHAGNKSGVVKKLTRHRGAPNYENSVGMIDEDPLSTQPPDLEKFREIRYLGRHKIRILHYRWLNNRLLVLCPRLEEWIVEAAREARINLNEYGLPSDPRKLHEVINLGIKRFRDLVEDLMKQSNRVKELQAQLKKRARRTR